MSKVIVIRHSEEIDIYLEELSKAFTDQSPEIVFIQDKKINQLEKYSKINPKIYLVEFFDGDFALDLMSKMNLLGDDKVFFIFNREVLSLPEWESLKTILTENIYVGGWIDISYEVFFYIPFFRELFKKMENREKIGKLKTVGKQLEGLVGNTLAELQRVKNIHEQVVPMRTEKIKGIEILSKYSAGEKSGGDFFDVISGKNEFILLLTSSISYVVSSIVLAHFEVLKGKTSFEDEVILDFIGNVEAELHELGYGKRPDDVQLFIIKFDLKKFSARGYVFGKFDMISNLKGVVSGNVYPFKKVFAQKAYIEVPFKRGEKLVLLSPGIKENFSELIKDRELIQFMKDHFARPGKDLLNELFFTLHKNCNGDFLIYDASAIYIEVSKNAIFQI